MFKEAWSKAGNTIFTVLATIGLGVSALFLHEKEISKIHAKVEAVEKQNEVSVQTRKIIKDRNESIIEEQRQDVKKIFEALKKIEEKLDAKAGVSK